MKSVACGNRGNEATVNLPSARHKSVSMAFVMLSCVTCLAADLTVENGSPYTVTVNENYSNVYASDKITISPGVTFKVSARNSLYQLQSDALDDGTGHVDAIRIEAGATFNAYAFANLNSATGRIVFAGANARITREDNGWNTSWFRGEKWEIVDETGDGINFILPGSWSNGKINADNVGVRLSGTGDVKLSAGWTNTRSEGGMSIQNGFCFANTGRVIFESSYWGTYKIEADGVFAPSVTGVYLSRSSYKNRPVTLDICSGKIAAIKNLEAYDGGSCKGGGTIRMGEDDTDGVLKAGIEGDTLMIEKVGSGTLTVSSTTNLPILVVRGGRVVLKSSLPICSLTIDEGCSVVVDGCAVMVASADMASVGRISTANAGNVRVTMECNALTEVRCGYSIAPGVTFEKTGDGKLVFFGDKVETGAYDVNGGTVAFSKLGLTDTYYRFTFKQILGWINYSNVLRDPAVFRLAQIAFFDSDGTRRYADNYSSSSFTDQKFCNPWELTPGGVTMPEGTEFVETTEGATGDNWRNVANLFSQNQGQCVNFGGPAQTNAGDSATWLVVSCRLPSSNGIALDGYSFQTRYNIGVPCAWTIESSKTGQDGDWRVIADERKYVHPPAVRNNHNAGWLDGFAGKGDGSVTNYVGRLAERFHYVEPGVSAADAAVKMSLSNGGTMDFSSVSGGQTVDEIACDLSAGGGVAINAKIAPIGFFRIAGDINGLHQLPIEMPDVQNVDNLKSWSVYVNGVLRPKMHVECRNERLCLCRDGFQLIFR